MGSDTAGAYAPPDVSSAAPLPSAPLRRDLQGWEHLQQQHQSHYEPSRGSVEGHSLNDTGGGSDGGPDLDIVSLQHEVQFLKARLDEEVLVAIISRLLLCFCFLFSLSLSVFVLFTPFFDELYVRSATTARSSPRTGTPS